METLHFAHKIGRYKRLTSNVEAQRKSYLYITVKIVNWYNFLSKCHYLLKFKCVYAFYKEFYFKKCVHVFWGTCA